MGYQISQLRPHILKTAHDNRRDGALLTGPPHHRWSIGETAPHEKDTRILVTHTYRRNALKRETVRLLLCSRSHYNSELGNSALGQQVLSARQVGRMGPDTPAYHEDASNRCTFGSWRRAKNYNYVPEVTWIFTIISDAHWYRSWFSSFGIYPITRL